MSIGSSSLYLVGFARHEAKTGFSRRAHCSAYPTSVRSKYLLLRLQDKVQSERRPWLVGVPFHFLEVGYIPNVYAGIPNMQSGTDRKWITIEPHPLQHRMRDQGTSSVT